MMCYRDRAFCTAAPVCANRETCGRYFDAKQRQQADVWWQSGGGEPGKAPVAFSDFRATCPDWKEDIDGNVKG